MANSFKGINMFSEKEPVKQAETGREKNGRFSKGYSGNPKGRPNKPEVEQLREALERAKQKRGKDFLDHLVDRAYESDTIAVALGKKVLPDLKAVEASVVEPLAPTVEGVMGLLAGQEDELLRAVISELQKRLKDRQELRAMPVPDAICLG